MFIQKMDYFKSVQNYFDLSGMIFFVIWANRLDYYDVDITESS